MKFAVGYQLQESDTEESFAELVRDFREHIAEVYFPWSNQPSGRSALTQRRGYTDWAAQQRMERELVAFRQMGLRLDLLFNANCYGGHAISQFLENQIASVLEHLEELVGGVDTVTTTSPFVARTLKEHFPKVEVRASVNMRIGTIKGMEYVADLFDGYYVQREYNRDLSYVRELRQWAEAHGKKLYLLANSGCLNFCSGQIFHDNLVAHETEVSETQNVPNWTPHVCWRYFKDRAHWPAVLQNSWIRPEDLHHYEPLFAVVKLATRMHARPRMVIQAYVERRFHGNVLDLFEPGFSPAFAPCVLDNDRFPADWFERTSTCGRRCDKCDYCAGVLEKIAVKL
jgi:collagenase-like PrtC family protease